MGVIVIVAMVFMSVMLMAMMIMVVIVVLMVMVVMVVVVSMFMDQMIVLILVLHHGLKLLAAHRLLDHLGVRDDQIHNLLLEDGYAELDQRAWFFALRFVDLLDLARKLPGRS